MTRSVRYQPILHTLYYTLHTEHAYCLSYRFLNNVVTTTVIEMVEILDGRLGKRSVERVRYVINNLLHLVIVKYGVISLVLCISTRLRLVTILSLLVKYLVIFHADPCNKSYISATAGISISMVLVSVGLAKPNHQKNTKCFFLFVCICRGRNEQENLVSDWATQYTALYLESGGGSFAREFPLVLLITFLNLTLLSPFAQPLPLKSPPPL